jgi:hypothetical protein
MRTLFIILSALVICSCKKSKITPTTSSEPASSYQENSGPYGKTSAWKSIGGDTLFTQNLTLTLFYTEKSTPCDICHYQQNYSLWNEFQYTYSISKCTIVADTLIMKDPDTNRKAIFKRLK